MVDRTKAGYDSQPEGEVRLGVTGHRVLTDLVPLMHGVQLALRHVRAAYPGRQLTVLSSLAEGADRMVVEEALHVPGARLVAVLPFPPHVYADDFGGRHSPSWAAFSRLLRLADEVKVTSQMDSNQSAYSLAGEYVATTCDVLLAVWDGQLEQGHGGTASVVQRARALARPLVIVRAGNRRPGTLEPTSLGLEQGSVVLERWP